MQVGYHTLLLFFYLQAGKLDCYSLPRLLIITRNETNRGLIDPWVANEPAWTRVLYPPPALR